jgi:ABC-type phosphate transport system substrate-binding protein
MKKSWMLLIFVICFSCSKKDINVTDTINNNLNPENHEVVTESVQSNLLPQIDSSTARIPITKAIYNLFINKYGYNGPAPLTSQTHGAWINLADKKVDIIFLVVPTKSELDYFKEKNVDIEMKIFGYDGLVFIGNEKNPVHSLTANQIRSIYTKEIINWQDLGGTNAYINAFIRNPESGSQRLFESLVWRNYNMPNFAENFSHNVEISWGMGEVTHVVIEDENAIGFNIMSYIDNEFRYYRNKPKLFAINGYLPTTENFTSGKYPFLTTSYVVIRADEPDYSPARKLYNWIGSEESRLIITENSTLTVEFSESVYIRFNSGNPKENAAMSNLIYRLNKQIIQRNELFQFTHEEIGYLRNGIYALSGKIFITEKYIQYFTAQNWYRGIINSDDDVQMRFNNTQRINLNTILSYEEELKRVLVNQ